MKKQYLSLRSLTLLFLVALGLSAIFYGCKRTEIEKQDITKRDLSGYKVPQEIIAKFEQAGFDIAMAGVVKFKEGYVVEGDLYLTEAELNQLIYTQKKNKSAGGATTKQYRTSSLVNTPVTLKVYMDSGFGTYMQSAFDAALARYNGLYLRISFVRTYNVNEANIKILSFYEVSTLLGVSAGFPSNGMPANTIYLNTYYYNNSSSRPDATTTIAHEIGHAIGYRHTDYMDRSYSCGGSYSNEGGDAQHIPNTPTGADPYSWMLSCSINTDRPFTGNDLTALFDTYPNVDGTMYRETSDYTVYVVFGGGKLAMSSPYDPNLYGGWGNVRVVPDGQLSYVYNVPKTGYILREENDIDVYYIDNGEKRYISYNRMNQFNFWGSVIVVPDGSLSVIPTGSPY